MRYIVLLSHGHLASGMKNTIELIAGKQDNLIAYDAYVDGNDDIKDFFREFVQAHAKDEIIAVTDVLGGSVNNDMISFNQLPNVYVICGMNAALVLNLVLGTGTEVLTNIRKSLEECLQAITFFEKIEENEDEEF